MKKPAPLTRGQQWTLMFFLLENRLRIDQICSPGTEQLLPAREYGLTNTCAVPANSRRC